MDRTIRMGDVDWRWATNVVCAGPDERLIVVRGSHSSPEDARSALGSASTMEWRDGGFRKWRVHRSAEGVTFISHYERLGPAPLEENAPLASLDNLRLEALLATARTVEGRQVRNPESGEGVVSRGKKAR